ncbi:DDB1- and CUL4-associated factor 12-like isoform X9 [Dreissena polymorpha]|uniref:DDB1- and CUL4-associated factor 12-like isoform X3 n=1 Tax=Dreissena polymorpha TaxID=45954 RepID=UPI002263F6C3|nr:DDB1- and CUL4-associated factor 12-like isoform X3 [Dreissena polymorpha]XP_052277582.1 DDB1- and CUL4-associated factor 12-like isoform X9 [Dreissena polymorpha]
MGITRDSRCRGSVPSPVNIPTQLFKYTLRRETGTAYVSDSHAQNLVDDYVSQLMPQLFREKEFRLGQINKVFSAKWLNHKQVVFGTKCNKLKVLDTQTSDVVVIPSLKSSSRSVPADCPCGIHSVAINPSHTLLATGAEFTNDVAVYKLPSFDPYCVGERAHTDWIFDLCWLDDEYLVTGSRDSNLGLWHIDDVDSGETSPLWSLQVPEYSIKNPVVVKRCGTAKRVRALGCLQKRKEVGVLSLNGLFHIWDVESFSPSQCRKLPSNIENVCMCVSQEKTLYGVGSQCHVFLIDPRMKTTLSVESKFGKVGIRSVSFRNDIITFGTGMGHILFYDLRAKKYLESGCGHFCSLRLGKGWMLHDDNYSQLYNQNIENAIYAHEYDETGTRMFVAGGPLPTSLWGNYAGLWS